LRAMCFYTFPEGRSEEALKVYITWSLQGFLFKILSSRWIGDHPQEE
jgi:hypothetical protein